MNVTQRLYDTRLKMITSDNNLHPLYFFRSIDLIRSRKTKYPKYDTFYLKNDCACDEERYLDCGICKPDCGKYGMQ